jgi:hypothetical protein
VTKRDTIHRNFTEEGKKLIHPVIRYENSSVNSYGRETDSIYGRISGARRALLSDP